MSSWIYEWRNLYAAESLRVDGEEISCFYEAWTLQSCMGETLELWRDRRQHVTATQGPNSWSKLIQWEKWNMEVNQYTQDWQAVRMYEARNTIVKRYNCEDG